MGARRDSGLMFARSWLLHMILCAGCSGDARHVLSMTESRRKHPDLPTNIADPCAKFEVGDEHPTSRDGFSESPNLFPVYVRTCV